MKGLPIGPSSRRPAPAPGHRPRGMSRPREAAPSPWSTQSSIWAMTSRRRANTGSRRLPPGFKHKGVCALLEGLRAELAIYSLSATTPAAPASRPARTPSTRHGRDQGRYASSLAAITACHGSGWLTRAALHPRLAAFLFLLRGAVSSARRAPTNIHFRATAHVLSITPDRSADSPTATRSRHTRDSSRHGL